MGQVLSVLPGVADEDEGENKKTKGRTSHVFFEMSENACCWFRNPKQPPEMYKTLKNTWGYHPYISWCSRISEPSTVAWVYFFGQAELVNRQEGNHGNFLNLKTKKWVALALLFVCCYLFFEKSGCFSSQVSVVFT